MSNKNIETKILVINFGGIGDQILFFPAIRNLKNIFKLSSVDVLTEKRSQNAYSLVQNVDKTITVELKGKKKFLNLLSTFFKIWFKKYDIVVSSGSSKLISIFLFLTGIKKRIGYDSGFLSRLLLSKPVKLHKNQYASKMYHDLVSELSESIEFENPDINIATENLIWASNQIGERNANIITIHPGVSQMSIDKNIHKSWSSACWFKLIESLVNNGHKVILTGGPDDEEIISEIKILLEKKSWVNDKVVDLYGKTKNLVDLASVITLSDLFVCVDSAPMHIAVGTRTPTVAVFGPTDDKKLLPQNEWRYKSIKNNEIDCSPCLWDKRQESCSSMDCLNIKAEQVFEEIQTYFQG